MPREKKDNADKSLDSRGRVMVYPDGTLSVDVDPEAISRQFREQFKASARSNLEEEKWREQPNE